MACAHGPEAVHARSLLTQNYSSGRGDTQGPASLSGCPPLPGSDSVLSSLWQPPKLRYRPSTGLLLVPASIPSRNPFRAPSCTGRIVVVPKSLLAAQVQGWPESLDSPKCGCKPPSRTLKSKGLAPHGGAFRGPVGPSSSDPMRNPDKNQPRGVCSSTPPATSLCRPAPPPGGGAGVFPAQSGFCFLGGGSVEPAPSVRRERLDRKGSQVGSPDPGLKTLSDVIG